MQPLAVRPDLEEVEPYVSPQRPGWSGHRMNTNESPYPPPPAVIDTFLQQMRDAAFNRYPDRDASVLRSRLAAHVVHPEEGLWLANGSNEVFLHLFLAFGGPGRSALVFEPTYSLHSLIPKIAGTKVVAGERSDTFAIDLEVAYEGIERAQPEIVIVCSPNNPTGLTEGRPVVEAILERAPGLVVVDEAYVEFAADSAGVHDLLGSYPNLVVVRTFSKAWSLAGARLGYLLADPALVEQLARVRLPYHLSTPTQLLGEAVLQNVEAMREAVAKVARERDRLITGLQSLGVKTYPSDANFVLFEVSDAERVWSALLDRGILIRRYGSSPHLENCLRVTAGLPDETEAFLLALEEIRDE